MAAKPSGGGEADILEQQRRQKAVQRVAGYEHAGEQEEARDIDSGGWGAKAGASVHLPHLDGRQHQVNEVENKQLCLNNPHSERVY